MKKILLLLCLIPVLSQAQQVQWVAKVIKSSSDLGGKQYSSRRVVGRPDAFPQGGDSPNAWAPKNANDGHDFIEVEFAQAQSVKQIAIFENLNSGCLVKVMAGTGDGKYKEVFRNKINLTNWKAKSQEFTRGYYFNRKRRKVVEAPQVNVNPGIEYAVLDEPLQNIKALRVVFNFTKTAGDKQIDAIGISDSEQPILPQINTSKSLENLAQPEVLYTSKTSINADFVTPSKLYVNIADEEDRTKIYSFDLANGALSNLTALPTSINKNPNYNYLATIIGGKYVVGGAPFKKATSETGYQIFSENNGEFNLEKPVQVVAYSSLDDASNLSANADGSIIVMAVESDISQGGMDLYFAKVKEDGSYSLLQNLGKAVNSANDEYSPFLSKDGKTLFFASNGFSSHGYDDLYFTQRLDDTWKNWSEPINLGPKINSAASETSMVYDDENEYLYFTTYKDDAYQLCRVKLPKSLLQVN
ncbi:hypothetical protein [Pelobium manganitolerans]|uniref:hypothetical protein n=1 Tax=Pelobium manganitolerans TaxID=1842495 RepID=UPI003FA3A3E5